MKKLTVSCLLLACFALTSHSQETKENNKPKAIYQIGTVLVTVWENKIQGKYGEFTAPSFKVEKIYKKDDKWESTSYFDLEELLKLRAAIDRAINEEVGKKE